MSCYHFLNAKTKEPQSFISIRNKRRYIYICFQCCICRYMGAGGISLRSIFKKNIYIYISHDFEPFLIILVHIVFSWKRKIKELKMGKLHFALTKYGAKKLKVMPQAMVNGIESRYRNNEYILCV